MFTGIVEAVGTVKQVEDQGDGRKITIEANPEFLEGVKPGDSIAVDGACLTPVRLDGGCFTVQAVGTTLSRTVAARYRDETSVNLERALQMGDRLDGHLVQGHVDGIGHLKSIVNTGQQHLLLFTIPRGVHEQTLTHGSITLNGVSLTVNRLDPDGELVEVALIPHTLEHTNLGALEPGDPVNVEGDLIGKYVGKLLRGRGGFPDGSNLEEGRDAL